ncbi:MAG: DUF4783 domain-containing protein [Bacteroidales bacterium]|nr:DUF4783 domain-containing protein [Bacteroidales bacterium]MBN2632363.1 DUF4783 domain-containing protein [Bacteroidales bacterium]
MNIISIFTVLSLLAGSVSSSFQEQARIPAGISVAFRAGNAAELSKYLNSTVELLLPQKEDFYKKNVAEAILKEFFASHPTKDFIIRYQGVKNDVQYAIGNLKTEKGDFRVYFLMKTVDKGPLIHLIRIDLENGKQNPS